MERFDLSRGVKLFQNLVNPNKRHIFNVVGSWMSEKYDGVRAIYLGDGRLVTCRGHSIDVPVSFSSFKGLPDGAVLDGELWMGRQNFGKISGLTRKSKDRDGVDEWSMVKYLVFDIIYMPNVDVSEMPFEARQSLLSKFLKPFAITDYSSHPIHPFSTHQHQIGDDACKSEVDVRVDGDDDTGVSVAADVNVDTDPMLTNARKLAVNGIGIGFRSTLNIYRVEQYKITSMEGFNDFYGHVIKNGGEGVVIVPSGDRYQRGIKSNYKLKAVDEIEGVVIDYKNGSGKNDGLVGSFLMQLVNNDGSLSRKTFSIGTGLTAYQRQYGRTLYPVGTVLTCYHNGLTASGVPRFPRLKGVRVDIVVRPTDPRQEHT